MKTNGINDLIFKELLKRGYSLEGNTRVWNIADSKLWYLTPDQSQAYLDLENSKEYQKMASSPEFKLVEKWINLLKKEAGAEAVNVIDLGCGDGKKAAHVIEHLKKAGIKVRYCPIDIRWNISDFENLENVVPLLVKGEFKKNLFLLLGYTLGNFEIHELLYAIKSAMSCGDLFVAVAGIGSSKWEERAKTAKDDKKTNLFFKHILLQLGMKKGDVEFGSRFKNSRIEFYYRRC
jgi:uncharacterized SAM-dependent methyltransferase